MNPVTELNMMLRKAFGPKISATIARAPGWGHADNCWIIYGNRAEDAALFLVGRFGGSYGMNPDAGIGVSATVTF